jgi:hypothetical protein
MACISIGQARCPRCRAFLRHGPDNESWCVACVQAGREAPIAVLVLGDCFDGWLEGETLWVAPLDTLLARVDKDWLAARTARARARLTWERDGVWRWAPIAAAEGMSYHP